MMKVNKKVIIKTHTAWIYDMIYYSNIFPLTAVELHTVVYKVRNDPQKVSRYSSES